MPRRIDTISKREFFKIISYRYSVPIADKIIMRCWKKSATLFDDQMILYKTVKSIKPKTILEIGTQRGYLTMGLFLNAIYANVYTIDIYKGMKVDVPAAQKAEVLSKNEVGRAFRNKIPGIYQILGDSRDIDTYSAMKGKVVGLVFIDGNHSFRAVIKDTRNVLRFTRKGSIIFWHDFKDDKYGRVKAALGSLARSGRLKIFHIDATWLAFAIL